MSTQPSDAPARRLRWPWVVLGLGLAWTVLIRVPLVLNAHDHLDSDLAVDGLTLVDALNGHWRWHYPATPSMGIAPLFSSYLQALVWGATPITLVSGGTLIWCLVVASTFWLAARTYGLEVAGWSILPLVFSSLGTIWLSGRITGGHLLTLVWHTVAFVGLHDCLRRGGWRRAAALGLWCGLGLYLDAMFLVTVVTLVAAGLIAWVWGERSTARIGLAAVFLVAIFVGLIPREIGRRVDPYDAYPSQLEMSLSSRAIAAHSRLLGLYCLPRLIAGIELHHLEKAATTIDTLGLRIFSLSRARMLTILPGKKEWLALLAMAAFLVALCRLAREWVPTTDSPRTAVSLATLASALLVVAAFLVNRNIFNSDNYRYLVFLVTPWALGFGLWMNDLAKKNWAGRLSALFIAGLLFEVMTSAAFLWYRDERLYIDEWGCPVRTQGPDWSELTLLKKGVAGGSPTDSSDFVISSDVTHMFGGYWDVYRIAFLSGGRVTGVPFPWFPNRFRGWSRGLGPGRGKLLVLFPAMASRKLGTKTSVDPGAGVVQSAQGTNWPSALATSWLKDGRDRAELSRLRIVVP
jgi:hypothetical protein